MQRVSFVSDLLYHFNSMAMKLLSQLSSLFKINPNIHNSSSPSEEEELSCPTSYLLLLQNPPGLVTVSMHLLIAHIKRKLPVAPLGRGEASRACAICLDGLEEGQEARELSDCEHVFHRECLDCWVDQGQLTCPLCRSMLFSTKGRGVLKEIRGF